MPSKVLKGQTIVLTGTKKTQTVHDQITAHGGQAVLFPLITTQQVTTDQGRYDVSTYDWLIFTSQNAVDGFLTQYKGEVTAKVAAVGEKTKQALEEAGIAVHFMPTIYSADVFIKEFPSVVTGKPRCLFIRGSHAKPTIREGLPYKVDEWTVYETVVQTAYIEPFISCIRHNDVTVIFASPSAVEVFHTYIAPTVGWDSVRVAAIGHVTAAALRQHSVTVAIQPQVYTMQAVVDEIIQLEEQK